MNQSGKDDPPVLPQHHTDLPQYYYSNNIAGPDLNDDRQVTLYYDTSIKRKILMLIAGITVFFAWELFYGLDPEWLTLAVALIGSLVFYYRLRIRRIVKISDHSIIQTVGRRRWEWSWDDLQICIEKYTELRSDGEPGMRRITLIHQNGRDIAVDSHMPGYREASRIIMDAVKKHNINLKRHKVIGFLLIFW